MSGELDVGEAHRITREGKGQMCCIDAEGMKNEKLEDFCDSREGPGDCTPSNSDTRKVRKHGKG